MKVKRLAECSPWSILQYFRPALSDNWSSFLSGSLRQVLLYNQQSIYIYAYMCQCVDTRYTTQMSTVVSLICLGPSFQKMTRHFCSMGHFGPQIFQNLKPCPISPEPEETSLFLTFNTLHCIMGLPKKAVTTRIEDPYLQIWVEHASLLDIRTVLVGFIL